MRKLIITLILFPGLLSITPIKAEETALRNDSPGHHVVVPGDTLWGIASRFLKDPWRWPEIWGFNRAQVKNPHKIYPGDVVILEKTRHGARLRLSDDDEYGVKTVKLSPKIRTEQSGTSAIPSIPAAAIEPFLSQPLIIEKNGLDSAPYILGSSEGRVALSTGNTAYVSELPKDKGTAWQIFRPGKALKDPDQKRFHSGLRGHLPGKRQSNRFRGGQYSNHHARIGRNLERRSPGPRTRHHLQ